MEPGMNDLLPIEEHLTQILSSFPLPVRATLLEVRARRDDAERSRRSESYG